MGTPTYGTMPIKPIELPIKEPTPPDCDCAWTYSPKTERKYLKFLNSQCGIAAHRAAFIEAHETVLTIEPPKRPRGRPRNPGGQWHKKPSSKSA